MDIALNLLVLIPIKEIKNNKPLLKKGIIAGTPQIKAKPIKLFFMDEMRYGLMSNVRRSWSKVGERTVIENQQAFSSRYCYSAIDPIEGDSFHLMDFKSTTSDELNLFLTALQERFSKEHLVIVWDNAPSHRTKSLQREDMTLIPLPSYSPQLNPVERYFGEMRKVTANQIFRDGMEALSLVVEQGLLKLSKSKQYLQKLCGYEWIREQWNDISESISG